MMRRFARILGTVMIVAGVCSVGWALTVWQWQDPFTALYTKYRQHQLASSYEKVVADYDVPGIVRNDGDGPTPRPSSLDAQRRKLELTARAYRLQLKKGQPLGRLKVPRLGLSVIVVNGTDSATLKSGPGRDPHTYVPGEGELVYIAGHRTTYGAPFAHIDALRRGDRVTFELPYATFEYEITGHRIVKANETDVLRSRGREVLALQACHPRFFASHRWIAYARPVRVIPRDGEAYSVRRGSETLAAPAPVVS
jgi:sortase A